jgi:DNA recombination protein RmuC
VVGFLFCGSTGGILTMTETLLIISTIVLAVLLGVVLFLLARSPRPDTFAQLSAELMHLVQSMERIERALREELARSRDEAGANAQRERIELSAALEQMRRTVEEKLSELQERNEKRLEEIRATVDEKLHTTLERRLGESFKHVSERLELVHKGLGEMQSLASGVGDLKKVLMNVKTRGTWGEIQLGTLLDQILTPEQYVKNVVTKLGGTERVEFAIRIPSKDQDGEFVLLPLDAKFPLDVYQRLVDASELAQKDVVEDAGKELESRIKMEARRIKEKYVDPPRTTDFAILFLPTEGLYAEVTRRAGLVEALQREFRVTVMGPTTVAAFLNSLQMGFRTLAIERRSSEVWALLGAVKTEFGRFGEMLEKTQKKLQEASNTIEDASKRSRAIERKLRDVHQVPLKEGGTLLERPSGEAEEL